eukprot:TRINITY_DN1202_c0_g1_i2.p1 TRINITY_DN1202_c0_g1~~TRINITY_DN1202_c0_g1_i2.p1  ORF type:complete len:493 (-),score=138.66 TRINITY_DN1202_c0_g1_i2:151-1629(-)
MFKELWMCLRGPRLYCIYPTDPSAVVSRPYTANRLERYGDMTMMSIHLMKEVMRYGSPLLIPYLFQRGVFTYEGFGSIVSFIVVVSMTYALSWSLRGLGRALNPTYRSFLAELQAAKVSWSIKDKTKILGYDFEFHAWPVEFIAPPSPLTHTNKEEPFSIWSLPLKPLSWLLAHSVGLSLVYPGSTALLQAGIHPQLMQGRSTLIRRHGGLRYKLKASNGNTVDTMYLQRSGEKGKTLIINCEGNGGYYEIGVTSPAVDSGHSVLGWNHPGFGWSTGRPFPGQERAAADAVIQFAIQELGYKPSEIIIYGWSIGGFTASWLASQYPELKCIILDATFDVLLPLAVARMPQKLTPLIKDAVKTYIDLNVAEQLSKYHGKIRLVRRSQDEMLTTDPDDFSTNRGNNLLHQLLTMRYPKVINSELLWKYLKLNSVEKDDFVSKLNLNDGDLKEILNKSAKGDNGDKVYPSSLGSEDTHQLLSQETKDQLTIFLVI